MIVLSHRGYWKTADEKNTEVAFRRSFDLGFGTETDIRDLSGELVISHDPPKGGEITFARFLELVGGRDLPLALNIKADGLAAKVAATMATTKLSKWFVFDMSIPDTIHQLKAGNPVFSRVSEYEAAPAFETRAAGIWLDAFEGEWWTPELISTWTTSGKTVCIVSPDLHKRDPLPCWRVLHSYSFPHPERVLLCTDRPEEARELFGGGP